MGSRFPIWDEFKGLFDGYVKKASVYHVANPCYRSSILLRDCEDLDLLGLFLASNIFLPLPQSYQTCIPVLSELRKTVSLVQSLASRARSHLCSRSFLHRSISIKHTEHLFFGRLAS